MFGLADFSIYVAIIATLGEAGIDAVTTNLNISFTISPQASPRPTISTT
jgi:acyl-coenzyme A thioesterase PaaI-like protein